MRHGSEDAHRDGERGREHLLLEEGERRLADALAAMLLGGDEEIEIPGAGLELLREISAPDRCIDGVRIADGLAVGLDDAADGVGGAQRDVDLGLGRRERAPPLLDVGAREPAADQVPVAARRGAQRTS